LHNISGTNAATWQQKLAADIPSLELHKVCSSIHGRKLQFLRCKLYHYMSAAIFLSPIYTKSGALIFVMFNRFCQALRPILRQEFSYLSVQFCVIWCPSVRCLQKLDGWPGKIGQTAKIGPILAVLCKWPFSEYPELFQIITGNE